MQQYAFPSPDEPLDPAWVAPLEAVARVARHDRRYQLLDAGDFMVMRDGCAATGPTSSSTSTTTPVATSTSTTRGTPTATSPPGHGPTGLGATCGIATWPPPSTTLDLWELPWMKEGLEHLRRGLKCDERSMRRTELFAGGDDVSSTDPAERPEGGNRGHLRLV